MTMLRGRVGLIGDIHGEAGLLRSSLDALAGLRPDSILCTGDVVDGPGPVDACCEMLIERSIVTVRGNHERWFLAGSMRDLPGATPASGANDVSRAFLASFPVTVTFSSEHGDVLLCHGLGEKDMARLTPDDRGYALEVNEELHALIRRPGLWLVVTGHTHRFMVRRLEPVTFVNPGTLKHDEDPGFCLLDLEALTVTRYDLAADGAARVRDVHPID